MRRLLVGVADALPLLLGLAGVTVPKSSARVVSSRNRSSWRRRGDKRDEAAVLQSPAVIEPQGRDEGRDVVVSRRGEEAVQPALEISYSDGVAEARKSARK